jgi:hypothetical protein
MGFKKTDLIDKFKIITQYETASGGNEVVTHFLTYPDAKIRNEHQRRLVSVKGRGRSLETRGTSDAHWYMWQQCIVGVEGYDDIEDPNNKEELVAYFGSDHRLRKHAEDSVQEMMGIIAPEEVEEEKS